MFRVIGEIKLSLFEIIGDMFNILTKYWYRFLVVGVGTTLLLALITVIGGTILGTLVAIARMSKFSPFARSSPRTLR